MKKWCRLLHCSSQEDKVSEAGQAVGKGAGEGVLQQRPAGMEVKWGTVETVEAE